MDPRPEEGTDGTIDRTLLPGEEAPTATLLPSATVEDCVASRTSDRYRFLRLHAEGGLGKVWVARDVDLNREVALKEVRPECADRPETLRRFLREAQVTGQLEHPNIVPVYEMARRREDGQPFYTMRLLRGRTLLEEVAKHHAFTPGKTADPLGRQKLLTAFVAVCQAVGYAHSRGVIHRDLKPENVMIGSFGEVVVLDWGLARMVGRPDSSADLDDDPASPPDLILSDEAAALTTRGSVGTPAYMAPEQVQGPREAIDARTDIYGLGATLFEILTGHPPFEGRDLAEIYRKIADDPTPRARDRVSGVPRSVEAIAQKAMAKEPQARYASAADLAEDVQRFLAGEPVTAWREPLTIRARRWMRKHRVMVTSSAAASLVAFLALGVTLANDRARALGLVETLEQAQIGNAPTIVNQLEESHRFWTDGRLRARFAAGPDGSSSKLRDGLGLLRFDRSPLPYLYDQMLATKDAETIHVIRDALGRTHRPEVADRLRLERPSMAEDRRFAASCALALYDPLTPIAEADRAWLVAHLLGMNRSDPVAFHVWAGLLDPILPRLVPELIAAYIDPARNTAEHAKCADLLVKHVTRPGDLSELIQVAEAQDFSRFLTLLARNPPQVVPLLRHASTVDSSDADPDVRARRRAQATIALARLGSPELTWRQLRQTPEPSTRWWLVDRLAPLGADPLALIDRLKAETDSSVFQALILALGDFDAVTLPDSQRTGLAKSLEPRYRTDRHSGVHSSIDWLLRRWNLDASLRTADRELVGPPRADRNWFVSRGSGLEPITFAIIQGPVTFRVGPTKDEHHIEACAFDAHERTIPRSFAIATREVTVGEFKPFLEYARGKDWDVVQSKTDYDKDISPDDTCPMNRVSWYMAAEYCRWLGDLEKLEPCYPPIPDLVEAAMKTGELKTIPQDYLEPKGYRLPTETEWEFACRGGTTAPHPFGSGDKLLGRFAWFPGNTNDRTLPVGLLWPNDRGLFDVLGNIREVCQPPFLYKLESPPPHRDGPDLDPIRNGGNIPQRGGCYVDRAHFCRSSCHQLMFPEERLDNCGFRLARTIP